MMAIRQLKLSGHMFGKIARQQNQTLFTGLVRNSDGKDMIDMPDNSAETLPIPPYVEKSGESLELKKARLLYQSRKRGMLENGLLLSSFAAKYLSGMSMEQVKLYDRLINLPSNDWDIYYWAIGRVETPSEFNNEIMSLLKEYVKNKSGESRIRQPDLYSKEPAEDLFRSP